MTVRFGCWRRRRDGGSRYSEGQENGRLISDPKEVSLLQQRYDTLRSQALTPQRLAGPAGADARRAMSTTELAWFKSSYSGSQGDDCVEIAVTEEAIHVRDSKDVSRPGLSVGRDGWAQFVRYAAHG